MTFGTSLELFALVWALFCVVAGAVVIDSLLTGVPRWPGAAGGVAARRRSPMALADAAPAGREIPAPGPATVSTASITAR